MNKEVDDALAAFHEAADELRENIAAIAEVLSHE